MDQQALRKFVLENPGLVTIRPCGGYPGLFILKYTRKVFYDGLWNDYLEECRGTIVDAEYNVISRPFSKIYNYGVEKRSPVLPANTPITAFRKVNGFLTSFTWYKGDILVSTTGSTDSPFVEMAREMIAPDLSRYRNLCENNPSYTFMAECVHKNDPHIIPEVEGMYLLGYRENTWNSVVTCDSLQTYSDMLGTLPVESFNTRLEDLVKMSKTCTSEGYVFYAADGTSAKIKSPHYLCLKALARKKDILSLKKNLVEEEYYPLLAHIQENIDMFTKKTEQDRLQFIREFLTK